MNEEFTIKAIREHNAKLHQALLNGFADKSLTLKQVDSRIGNRSPKRQPTDYSLDGYLVYIFNQHSNLGPVSIKNGLRVEVVGYYEKRTVSYKLDSEADIPKVVKSVAKRIELYKKLKSQWPS